MDDSSGVGVLDKAAAVLAALESGPMTLAGLVQSTGLARPTAHRLAVALEHHRLVGRDLQGRFVLGPRLAELATAAPGALRVGFAAETGDLAREALAKMDIPAGVTVEFGGQIREQGDAFRQMGLLVLLGVILVYMVMAGQYEAYLDPFVIMFSIPFALTGVAFAYLITGMHLSLQALLGVVMLVGIVVNNAIVLVDYINYLRRDVGQEMNEAIVHAGCRRLRPILMTTAATVFGHLPLIFAHGPGAGRGPCPFRKEQGASDGITC